MKGMRIDRLSLCIALLLIAAASPAAASIVQLTDGPAIDSYPFWSPDGEAIAFTSFDGDHVGIRVLERQNLRQVTDNLSWEFIPFDPWSPDGKTLLFLSADAGEFNLWTMNPNGTERVRLTEEGRIIPGLPLSGYGADWSADGTQIVYTSCLFDNSAVWMTFMETIAEGSPAADYSDIRKDADIWIMNADGSNKQQLTAGGDARSPRWQPHGEKIAYLSDTTGSSEIWSMNSDGTGKMQIAFYEGNVSEFSWSPDGSAIACVVAAPPGEWPEFSLWITDIDGSESKQLTSGNRDRSPVWSPDGSRIAFGSMSRNQTALWVMNRVGSDLAPLAPGNYMMQQWSPDGRTIVISDGNDLYALLLEETDVSALPGFGALFSAAALLLAGYLSKR